jgi:hypothetical protein
MGQMITPSDVHGIHEYEGVRNDMRRRAVALRKRRRLEVGDRVTVTFENRDTILYQLHETMRDEGITGQEALEAECEAYAALLPSDTELSATLAIAVSPGNAAAELKELAGICEVTALMIGEHEILATVDEGTSVADMASLTCYVRFELTAEQSALYCRLETPVTLRISHPNYQEEAALVGECRRLVAEDLE